MTAHIPTPPRILALAAASRALTQTGGSEATTVLRRWHGEDKKMKSLINQRRESDRRGKGPPRPVPSSGMNRATTASTQAPNPGPYPEPQMDPQTSHERTTYNGRVATGKKVQVAMQEMVDGDGYYGIVPCQSIRLRQHFAPSLTSSKSHVSQQATRTPLERRGKCGEGETEAEAIRRTTTATHYSVQRTSSIVSYRFPSSSYPRSLPLSDYPSRLRTSAGYNVPKYHCIHHPQSAESPRFGPAWLDGPPLWISNRVSEPLYNVPTMSWCWSSNPPSAFPYEYAAALAVVFYLIVHLLYFPGEEQAMQKKALIIHIVKMYNVGIRSIVVLTQTRKAEDTVHQDAWATWFGLLHVMSCLDLLGPWRLHRSDGGQTLLFPFHFKGRARSRSKAFLQMIRYLKEGPHLPPPLFLFFPSCILGRASWIRTRLRQLGQGQQPSATSSLVGHRAGSSILEIPENIYEDAYKLDSLLSEASSPQFENISLVFLSWTASGRTLELGPREDADKSVAAKYLAHEFPKFGLAGTWNKDEISLAAATLFLFFFLAKGNLCDHRSFVAVWMVGDPKSHLGMKVRMNSPPVSSFGSPPCRNDMLLCSPLSVTQGEMA
ncbi:hypothetical protein ACRALDRAFT_211416 [Sodiomyces alcalophilus JCM 7366]|uniref:uncharacterized protein n=1 Tax=Sodiomyces alcalophilus JCM 7366 TaxID=591952 RepID=UPI0039B5252E